MNKQSSNTSWVYCTNYKVKCTLSLDFIGLFNWVLDTYICFIWRKSVTSIGLSYFYLIPFSHKFLHLLWLSVMVVKHHFFSFTFSMSNWQIQRHRVFSLNSPNKRKCSIFLLPQYFTFFSSSPFLYIKVLMRYKWKL